MRKLALLPVAAAALALLAPSSDAQSLVGYDGVTGDVIVFTGGPGGTCSWPTGPTQFQFSTQPMVEPCQLPTPPGAAATTDLGGISVKQVMGEYYNAGADPINGGGMVGLFDADGVALAGESLAIWGYGSITGMAYSIVGGKEAMYFTDGSKVGKFGAGISCGGFPSLDFTFSFSPFSGPGILTGLDYDPTSDTFWACTSVGDVIHFDSSGNQLLNFVPTFIGPHLTGIAIDGANGSIYLTDGTWVLQVDQTGALGTPTFWWPTVLETAPGSLVGLDWVPAGVNYGTGTDLGGGTAPHLSAGGYSYMGNLAFSLDVTGGVPSSAFAFYWGVGELCPSIPVAGLDVLILPPFNLAGLAISDAAGDASLGFPLPPIPAFIGANVFAQAIGLPTSGLLQSTEGLSLTLSGI